MQRLKTKTVEQIYSVLMKYAEASPKRYDKEGFIYSFGVVFNIPTKFILVCMDGRRRTFHRKGEEYFMKGKGEARVNSIINKLLEEDKKLQKCDN